MKNILDQISRYNFWDTTNISSIGYLRKSYMDSISSYLGNKLVKVLVGQRRVGKSYILRQLISSLVNERKVNPKNIFYLNKEYLAFDEIKTSTDLHNLFEYYKKELKVKGKIYIFLDEVQNIENWENFVNSYAQDFTNEYELFITGSNSKLLSGELAGMLSGRYVQFEIFPFDLYEFSDYKKQAPGRETFLKYLQTGGLPELFHFNNEEIERHYIQSLKNTIILRDIVQRYKIKDVTLLDDIFKFLSVNIGNPVSLNSIVKYFKSRQKKTNYETLSSYVNYLKDTFIIHEAERYNLRGKKTLGGVKKYYLNDLTFKNYLYELLATDIGYNLENMVYLYLKRLGYAVSIGVLDNKEIDFVARKADKTVYIQVAYLLPEQKTIDREFGNLLNIKDNYPKMVISLDDIVLSSYKGIDHIRPWEMKDYLP